MDIAAGNGRGSKLPGVAPEADLVFVEVSTSDIPWSGEKVVESSFGDSVQLLEAIQFIFERADDRPCVVNVSLGTNGGPHDGTTLVEQGIDAMVSVQPNRAVVISASNSYIDRIHASGKVDDGGSEDLKWFISAGDWTENELEVWYDGGDEFSLEIIDPNGASLGTVGLSESRRLLDADGNTLIFVSHRRTDPNNNDNVIGVFMDVGVDKGIWTLRLRGTNVVNGSFHAWIERDDQSQSSFESLGSERYTLGSISCGHNSIVVGSYDAHKASLPLSYFSSAGPTRDGRQKPEISAPGHDVLAAHSRTGDGLVRKSGTSMAAPAVSGVIALMLSEANERGFNFDINEIRDIIESTARDNPPNSGGWEERYGHGRVDAAAILLKVKDRAP